MLLSVCCEGKDNNLNIIRMLAAVAVLISHAWPLTLGISTEDPVEPLLGYSLGRVAVFIFFIISGFLITGSFLRASSHESFIFGRLLRIIPALIVSVLFVALIIGPLVSSYKLESYLTDYEVYEFIIKNSTLVFLEFELPGVFSQNPVRSVVGSIWTLFYEVLCYCIVFFLGVAGLFHKRNLLTISIITYLVLTNILILKGYDIPSRMNNILQLLPPFLLGVLAFLWRDRIQLKFKWLFLIILVTFISFDTQMFSISFLVALLYFTLYFAYIPSGVIRKYNLVGDYSYGFYLYAFPIQGLVVWIFGECSPYENILLSFIPTLLLSVLSWHYIEKITLGYKRNIIEKFSTLVKNRLMGIVNYKNS